MSQFRIDVNSAASNNKKRQIKKIVIDLSSYIQPSTNNEHEHELSQQSKEEDVNNLGLLATPENSFIETSFYFNNNQAQNEQLSHVKKDRNKKAESGSNEFLVLQAKSWDFPYRLKTESYESNSMYFNNSNSNINKRSNESKVAPKSFLLNKPTNSILFQNNKPSKNSLFDFQFEKSYELFENCCKLPTISNNLSPLKPATYVTNTKISNSNSLPYYLKFQKNHQSSSVSNTIMAYRKANFISRKNEASLAKNFFVQNTTLNNEVNGEKRVYLAVDESQVESASRHSFSTNSANNINNKLPVLNKPSNDNVTFSMINHDNGQLSENHGLMFNLNDEIDKEINRIVKNYPSIVTRRKAMKPLPKLQSYLTQNHIKYEIVNGSSGGVGAAVGANSRPFVDAIQETSKPLGFDLNNINYGNVAIQK